MGVSFQEAHFPPESILMGIRRHLAYLLSTRHAEELLQERGVNVDHWIINPTTPGIATEHKLSRLAAPPPRLAFYYRLRSKGESGSLSRVSSMALRHQ